MSESDNPDEVDYFLKVKRAIRTLDKDEGDAVREGTRYYLDGRANARRHARELIGGIEG